MGAETAEQKALRHKQEEERHAAEAAKRAADLAAMLEKEKKGEKPVSFAQEIESVSAEPTAEQKNAANDLLLNPDGTPKKKPPKSLVDVLKEYTK